METAEKTRDAESAEREFGRRLRELNDFLENSVVGLHKVGPDGTILWANAADCQLLGYSPDEYIGRNIAEFHADQETLGSIMQRLLAGEALHEEPARLRCKDGSLRDVVISSNGHFEDGKFVNTRCFTRDVTQLRRAEAALHQARTHLAAIVESSDDAIIGVDLDERITSWNRGAMQMYGYAAEEMIGGPIEAIIPPELRLEEKKIVQRLRDGERIHHYETVRMRKDGERVDISLTVSPVRDVEGVLVGMSKVGRDITERKGNQRRLVDEARRKDEFLAILAHELRNPLAPIRYALTLAGQQNVTAEQRARTREIIHRQVEHMGRLLDDLLDVSRIARGRVELQKKWIDLTSVIGAAIDAARPTLDRKDHSLTLDLPREPLRLNADAVRITQILTNLLTNAAKYTDRGGSIHLGASRSGESIAIAVRDNGVGIAPEVLPQLFTMFSQAASVLDRSEGGLGIGLALVKGFAQLHGGDVEARSEGPGKGSEFVVRLPVGTPPEHEAPRSAQPSATSARSLRVLVADDNVDNAETCGELLKLWGHEVRIAHDGREALDTAAQFRPDVALIDIGMPRMNGYDVASAIRATPWGHATTLIAATGWGQEEDKQRAATAGFDHHLTKPMDPQRLQPLLASIR